MDRPIGYRFQVRVRGELGDQSAVHGLLDAIRDLGLSLVSVEAAAISMSPTDTGRTSGPPGTGPTALG